VSPTTIPESTVLHPPHANRLQLYCERVKGRFDEWAPGTSWNKTTWVALGALVALWATWFYATWATWGDLTIDCGREMYVPVTLLEGKTLYRDVWYLYGPAAPYLNSFLFRVFGVHLSVLYWAGSLSALGSAVLLYLCGMRMSSWVAGWTAGAMVLIQAFRRSFFCFPLPYSFASVYGCVAVCFVLWFAIRGVSSRSWGWVFGAGTAAATALLLKLEFGAACYLCVLLLIAARHAQQRSWKSTARDIAVTLPGIAVCVAVARWMISLGGYEFITQENFMSWPTSFFMKTYGKMWLSSQGLTLDGTAWAYAAARTAALVGIVLLLRRIAPRLRMNGIRTFLGTLVLTVALLCLAAFLPDWAIEYLRVVFFPQAMVLYVAVAAGVAWWFFLRHTGDGALAAAAILLSVSFLVGSRFLLAMNPIGYPIYYSGPAILSFLLLAPAIVPRTGHSKLFVFGGQFVICLVSLAIVVRANLPPRTGPLVPLTTERGTVRVSMDRARTYRAAIDFMKDAASRGDSVLSVPEDTSLYFLSSTHCPTRVYAFTPGLLAPGKMTQELTREIDSGPVRYVLWSNRIFPEYGAPSFGVDYDRTLGEYLKTHYRFLRPLVPGAPFSDWTAGVWERKAASNLP
jgi:hypothetical protein